MARSTLHGISLIGGMALASLCGGRDATAQERSYAPEQVIEYRTSSYPEQWERGVFVRATPDGSQAIIREKPNQFNPEGFQRATAWSEIRGSSAAPAQQPATQPATSPSQVAAAAPSALGPSGAVGELSGPPMTQAEVLAFLRTNISGDPWANPQRDAMKQRLAELVKRRGLDFRYSEAPAAFNDEISRYGATSDIVFPLRDNYGAPTPRGWLAGTWNLGKIGATVDYAKDGYVYRQGEIAVANVGTLRVDANGSFAWESQAAQPTSGQWRDATAAEMGSQGGAGIVLLAAKGGYDWIVMRDRATTLPGERISVAEIATRQIREHGLRVE